MPIDDQSYDLIFASHVLEHIPWYQARAALTEAYRILDNNGDLEVWTINFYTIVQAYQRGVWVRDWDCGGRITSYMESVNGHLFAYEKDGNPFMWHKATFDFPSLRQLLIDAGFDKSNIRRMQQSRGHDHGPANLGIRATKII